MFKLEEPNCKLGYTLGQLLAILGGEKYETLVKWNVSVMCDCVLNRHGSVVAGHDLINFMSDTPLVPPGSWNLIGTIRPNLTPSGLTSSYIVPSGHVTVSKIGHGTSSIGASGSATAVDPGASVTVEYTAKDVKWVTRFNDLFSTEETIGMAKNG